MCCCCVKGGKDLCPPAAYLLLVALAFSACKGGGGHDAAPAADTVVQSGKQQWVEVQGLIMFQSDSIRFFYCDRPFLPFPVMDSAGVLQQALGQQQEKGSEQLYSATIWGCWQPAGPAAAADSLLRVGAVQDVQAVAVGPWCIPYDLWAEGAGWRLLVSGSLQRLSFTDLHRNETYFFEYFPPVRRGAAWVYESNNFALQTSLRVAVTESPCRQGSAQFAHRAEITLDGQRFSGCAVGMLADSL